MSYVIRFVLLLIHTDLIAGRLIFDPDHTKSEKAGE